MIVTVANPKGGAGKTTLSTCLAGQWHEQGFRVLLVDANSHQRASLGWHERNPEACPMVLAGNDAIHRQLEEMEPAYDLIVVDTPAEKSQRTTRALARTDLALVPVKCSELDIVTSGWAVEEIEQAQDFHPDLRALVVPNDVDNRTKLTRSMRDHLEALGLPIAQNHLPASALFGQAWARGLTPVSWKPKSPAAQAVAALADEIATLLNVSRKAA
jgi:chromosome partitioning protein